MPNIKVVHSKEYKLIITGSREFNNWGLLQREVTKFRALHNMPAFATIIVSGNCIRGADYLGEEYARRHGLKLELYPADWIAHGKAAVPIRNKYMAANTGATHCIVFWDGKSPGSADMIKQARKYVPHLKVINYGKSKK